jgi:hypothetical protein
MKEQCFNEGTMQAFLDGELSNDLLEKVARHVALCDTCALLLQESENESAFAFAALDNEFNSLVPTERIRTNLYQAISEIEKPKTSIWQKILSFGAMLSNPTVAAFASLIMIAAIFVTFWSLKEDNAQVAGNIPPVQTTSIKEVAPTVVNSTKINQPDNIPSNEKVSQPVSTHSVETQPKIEKAVYRIPKADNQIERAKFNRKNVVPVSNEAISGEETYVQTIASLSETVNSQKDQVLRPSARIAFEKDMAIADNAIEKMKKEVKKNPKNEAAKQVLRNSYQNKIDLLNSVTEKNELMATLK